MILETSWTPCKKPQFFTWPISKNTLWRTPYLYNEKCYLTHILRFASVVLDGILGPTNNQQKMCYKYSSLTCNVSPCTLMMCSLTWRFSLPNFPHSWHRNRHRFQREGVLPSSNKPLLVPDLPRSKKVPYTYFQKLKMKSSAISDYLKMVL